MTINISGDSYRLRQHREHGMLPSDRIGKEEETGENVALLTGVDNEVAVIQPRVRVSLSPPLVVISSSVEIQELVDRNILVETIVDCWSRFGFIHFLLG